MTEALQDTVDYRHIQEGTAGAAVAQSVQRLAARWTTEGSGFEFRYGQEL
jgi:hypothetical protein